jgi:hypothetical protein
MKFIKKIPAAEQELRNQYLSDGWKKLREPAGVGMATLLSLPFMFINGFISLAVAYYLYSPFREMLNGSREFEISFRVGLISLVYVAAIYLFLIIHELLHACFVPNLLKSDKTFWGFNGLLGFVITYEKIKKSRFFVISIMPFLILSILLPVILNALNLLNGFVLFLCFINAAGSSVDCLNLCIVAIQVPNGSYLVSNGFETYFK